MLDRELFDIPIIKLLAIARIRGVGSGLSAASERRIQEINGLIRVIEFEESQSEFLDRMEGE